MSTYVYLSIEELRERGACARGVALFQSIAALRGKRRKIRVEWSALAYLWLESAHPGFGYWLFSYGLAPMPSFRYANLRGASLARANLDGASLDGASLVGASLVGADLRCASLARANLDGASLDGASLVGASLVGANLDGANLDGARMSKYDAIPGGYRGLPSGDYLVLVRE